MAISIKIVRDESLSLRSRGATRRSSLSIRQRLAAFARLTPGCAAMLLSRTRQCVRQAVPIGFSGRSFVRSLPESLQPKAFLSVGMGAGLLIPVVESEALEIQFGNTDVVYCSLLRSGCQGIRTFARSFVSFALICPLIQVALPLNSDIMTAYSGLQERRTAIACFALYGKTRFSASSCSFFY